MTQVNDLSGEVGHGPPMSGPATSVSSYSVVIPVRDESETICELIDGILATARRDAPGLREIIVVDDGSTDGTWKRIAGYEIAGAVLHGVRLRRNFGKAAALNAGFRYAGGDVILTMDGDLQDDPKEIPRFLAAIAGGYDVVSGWKQNRKDPLSKTLPSRLFNRVTAWITGIPLHDFNCGFKAYRREVLADVAIYGELHRYIPVLENALGYRIGEIPVAHHARRHGRSKYASSRLLKGLLDLLTVLTLTRFAHRPGHIFGGMGIVAAAAGGFLCLLLAVIYGLGAIGFMGVTIILAVALLGMGGLILVALGLLAELMIQSRERLTKPDHLVAEEIRRSPEQAE
jgi:glycosyltransferase involved in cell wall biosynthesis